MTAKKILDYLKQAISLKVFTKSFPQNNESQQSAKCLASGEPVWPLETANFLKKFYKYFY